MLTYQTVKLAMIKLQTHPKKKIFDDYIDLTKQEKTATTMMIKIQLLNNDEFYRWRINLDGGF